MASARGGIPEKLDNTIHAPLDDVDEQEWKDLFCVFLERFCLAQIESIIEKADTTIHYGVTISFVDFVEMNMVAAHLLIKNPARLLPIFDEAICEVQRKWLEGLPPGEPKRKRWRAKPHCHARLTHLPANVPELRKAKLPRSSDVGHFVEVRGTVIRTGAIKMLEWERQMECAKCRHPFVVRADPEQYNNFPRIVRCPSDKEPPCQGKTFRLVEGDSKLCRDYQEIKIQEQIQQLAMGSIPRSMVVVLEDDLVDICKAGDDVTVNGVVMRRWRPMDESKRCDLEMFMMANQLRVNNEQRMGIVITDEMKHEFISFWQEHTDRPITAREFIVKSLCPQVYALHTAKLALLLVLIGGVPYTDPNGLRVRGESHLLLVGDPGTGKSQLLKYAAKLSPRSVLTAGIGTTSAGLTVTAVKDAGGEWMLEAGALVLADGGVCCIDEFSSIRKHDQTTIHEAMEQQTLSVAKAGLVCKLSTRCTVVAATNPKIKFDWDQSLSVNTAIGSPLLSRFDLILVLLDEQDEGWDQTVSSFLLNGNAGSRPDEAIWSLRRLQAYISYVSTTFQPKLSSSAEKILGRYYRLQRLADQRNQARTTVRLIESLVRLAQAHARLLCHSEVSVDDAVVAVQLVEASMQNAAMLGTGLASVLHSRPATDPEAEFAEMKERILRALRLQDIVPTQGKGTDDQAEGQLGDDDGVEEEDYNDEGNDEGTFDPNLFSQHSQQRRARMQGTQNSGNLKAKANGLFSSLSQEANSKKEVVMEEGDEEEESGLPRPSWRDEKLLSQKINNYETVSWDTFSAIESPVRKPVKPSYGGE